MFHSLFTEEFPYLLLHFGSVVWSLHVDHSFSKKWHTNQISTDRPVLSWSNLRTFRWRRIMPNVPKANKEVPRMELGTGTLGDTLGGWKHMVNILSIYISRIWNVSGSCRIWAINPSTSWQGQNSKVNTKIEKRCGWGPHHTDIDIYIYTYIYIKGQSPTFTVESCLQEFSCFSILAVQEGARRSTVFPSKVQHVDWEVERVCSFDLLYLCIYIYSFYFYIHTYTYLYIHIVPGTWFCGILRLLHPFNQGPFQTKHRSFD